jgi:hypothetical protein
MKLRQARAVGKQRFRAFVEAAASTTDAVLTTGILVTISAINPPPCTGADRSSIRRIFARNDED